MAGQHNIKALGDILNRFGRQKPHGLVILEFGRLIPEMVPCHHRVGGGQYLPDPGYEGHTVEFPGMSRKRQSPNTGEEFFGNLGKLIRVNLRGLAIPAFPTGVFGLLNRLFYQRFVSTRREPLDVGKIP